MPRFLLALLLLVLPLATLGPVGANAAGDDRLAAAPRWRTPVGGARLRAPFSYDRSHPFRARQRRGIDLSVRPGATVRSACSGRVTYAGPVPGHLRDVTVRCGALIATHLGLARISVVRGAPIAIGMRVGTTGPTGVVRLGARIAAQRWGWIDPLTLLDHGREPLPLVPAGRAPRAPAARPAPSARPVLPPMRRTGRVPVAPSVPPAWLLWAGVALLAVGLGLHGGLWRSRRGRAVRTALGLSRAAR